MIAATAATQDALFVLRDCAWASGDAPPRTCDMAEILELTTGRPTCLHPDPLAPCFLCAAASWATVLSVVNGVRSSSPVSTNVEGERAGGPDARVSRVMRGNKAKNTRPELRLRQALHAGGPPLRVPLSYRQAQGVATDSVNSAHLFSRWCPKQTSATEGGALSERSSKVSYGASIFSLRVLARQVTCGSSL